MQPEFRKIIADGDLLLQQRGFWYPFGPKWFNYRNESEEVRLLKQHMDNAFMAYKQLQHQFSVAQKNVQTDMQLLQMHKVDNSEVEYLIPHELSILEERDGIKYNSNKGGNNGQKGGGNGGGSNQNQNQNQNNGQGNNNQNQSKKGKQQNKPVSIMDLIMNGRVVLPNQQQAS